MRLMVVPDNGWDALGRGPLSQRLSVFGRRHARSSPERTGEARLRGKPALESNLAERRAARRDHCPCGLQPPSADVAMRRHARGGRKCAGEMIDAEARDIGKVGDREVFSEMLFDVCENTPQPSVIQTRQCQYRQPNGPVSACACASRAASISDDVSTSMRPAAVGPIISDSTDRPIWLMTSSCTPQGSGWNVPVPLADCSRPSAAQRRCWTCISVWPPAPRRYGTRRPWPRRASTRSRPLSPAMVSKFRRIWLPQALARSHEPQSRPRRAAQQSRAFRRDYGSEAQRIGWTTPCHRTT